MIKAVMSSDVGKVLLLGLSAENVRRLQADQPIMFAMADLDPTLDLRDLAHVVIAYGETEAAIVEELVKGGAL